MIIEILVIGIILLVFGIINICLGWKCDEMVAMSWLSFIGGVIVTISGYLS